MNTGEVIVAVTACICATVMVLAYVAIRYGKNTTKEDNK